MPSSNRSSQKKAHDTEALLSTAQSSTAADFVVQRTSSIPPWYYRLAITSLKPLYRIQVWRRSHKRENYRQEVAQRFGHHYPPAPLAELDNSGVNKKKINKTIWCHAVSLGETNTVAPVLDALLMNGYQIWLTNTTQTGFARGASRFADDIAKGRMSHSYVPVDSPAVIESFLAHLKPVAALFVETELWANTLTKLSQHHIPSILVNGRLSAASFTRYQKIGAVSASMMQNLSLIIAQDNESAKRFQQLGAHSSQIQVAGSLKWVINTPQITNDDRKNTIVSEPKSAAENKLVIDLGDVNRPIWVAASTHRGEESVAILWQQQLLANLALANSLLIIVPRHPERFDEVATLIQQSGLQMARRSHGEKVTAQTQVYLADSMGELMQWYVLADVALVGGSLVEVGGHNPVEPASVATPILMGQYTQSCQTVVDKLAEVGALYQPNNQYYQAIESNKSAPQPSSVTNTISDKNALIYEQLQCWLNNPQIAKQAGAAGAQLAEQQQSVLTHQLMMIENIIEQTTVINR